MLTAKFDIQNFILIADARKTIDLVLVVSSCLMPHVKFKRRWNCYSGRRHKFTNHIYIHTHAHGQSLTERTIH